MANCLFSVYAKKWDYRTFQSYYKIDKADYGDYFGKLISKPVTKEECCIKCGEAGVDANYIYFSNSGDDAGCNCFDIPGKLRLLYSLPKQLHETYNIFYVT